MQQQPSPGPVARGREKHASPPPPAAPSLPKAAPVIALALMMMVWAGRRAKRVKTPARKQVERQKKKAKRVARNVGLHSHMVKRHRANGTVSSNAKNNIFISAGDVRDVHRASLAKVFSGDLCESSLLSNKEGDARFLLCDCGGKLSHDFPEVSGPNDTEKWARVLKLSERARGK